MAQGVVGYICGPAVSGGQEAIPYQNTEVNTYPILAIQFVITKVHSQRFHQVAAKAYFLSLPEFVIHLSSGII